MLSQSAYSIIGVCLFTMQFFAVICETRFTKFIFHEEYSGLMCPTDSILFTNHGSYAKCVIQCDITPSCYGVFIRFDQPLCIGCALQYFSIYNEELMFLSGTVYLRRRTFIKVNEKRKWEDSKKYCEDLGGYLADIKSAEEEMYILNHFSPDVDNDMWIGGTDLGSEDIFLWRDGTKVADFYYNWAENEPDIGFADKDDHCVCLSNRSMVVEWRDSYCGSYYVSLCEFD